MAINIHLMTFINLQCYHKTVYTKKLIVSGVTGVKPYVNFNYDVVKTSAHKEMKSEDYISYFSFIKFGSVSFSTSKHLWLIRVNITLFVYQLLWKYFLDVIISI